MMRKRKNLERAVILGLLLTTSVYGSAWAAEFPDGIIEQTGTYGDMNTDTVIGVSDSGNAIHANKDITINGKTIEINANLLADSKDGIGKGIYVVSRPEVDINAADNVNIIASGEQAYGIHLYGKDNTLDINAGKDINIKTNGVRNASTNTSQGSYGLSSAYNKVTLQSGNNLTIEANATNLNRAYGFWVQNQDTPSETDNRFQADNIVKINSNLILDKNVSGPLTSAGIYEQGDGEISQKTNITGGMGVEITANVDSSVNCDSEAYGIYATTSALTIETGLNEPADEQHTVVIGAENNSKNKDSAAYGIYAYHSNVLTHTTTINNNNGSTYIYGIGNQNSIGINMDISDVTDGITVGDNLVNINSKKGNYIYGSTMAVKASDKQSVLTIKATETGDNILEAGTGAGAYIDKKATFEMTAIKGNNIIDAAGEGINAQDATVTFSAQNNSIQAGNRGIFAQNNSNVILNANQGINSIIANDNLSNGIYAISSNLSLLSSNNATVGTDNEVWSNEISGNGYGIQANNSTIAVTANQGSNIIEGEQFYGISADNSNVTITATQDNNFIESGYSAIWTNSADVVLDAGINNVINGVATGIDSSGGSTVNLNAEAGINIVQSTSGTAIRSYGENTSVTMLAQDNQISANTGIWGYNSGKISLTATTSNNQITTSGFGIYSDSYSDVDLTGVNNIIYAGDTTNGYGNYYAIYAKSQGDVDLISNGGTNRLLGAVYASGNVIDGETKTITDVTLQGNNNVVLSNAYIDNAGGLTDKKVISALYAQNGAGIKLDGDVNLLGTYADSSSDDLERVVWAYDTADIEINGLTAISTDSYDKATNSKDIAIAAGTATGLDEDKVNADVADRATVNINYESDSSITGDILAAYAGTVNIAAKDVVARNTSEAKMYITGNLLAGNNGILNVDLGNGGVLNGRADDYGDAGVESEHSNEFFNPAFSSDILTGGEVSLTMGEGSRWNVTGQSWITNLTTTQNAEDTLINLANAKEDYNTDASALTIGNLVGSTRFYMNLDGDRSASDMLYIKSANGHYDIYLQDEVTTAEINSDRAGNQFNGLRFATVGEGSNASFTVRSQGTGSAFDVEYLVGTDSYAGNDENTAYNSTTGGSANIEKPGTDSVDNFFEVETSAAETQNAANEIMTLANMEETAENAAANENTELTEVTNFKIIDRAGEKINDTGETILNMSRANYSNAIYMDRLNKRLGEARYINGEEDQGMWVRIRHDRIGKTDAYRSQNTMYELGYDEKQECDNGMRRVGFAIDYMHGDTGYSDIAGKGEIDRYGLWLYDTWMGDKGHYVDYVAKWGHLSNDFEVYTMQNGDKVTGDYSNNVFSISAEYGRKKDIGNDWYFEPQAQLQLARVTGADYTTNQDTKVSVDGINSLIGRAGFRLGKDFGEEKQSTVYIKADVLHEFLGDQDVYVYDDSTDNKWAGISYENKGTWYDVGIGFAAMMSKNSYAFLDLEKSFGHDNDETYQINAGMQWTF